MNTRILIASILAGASLCGLGAFAQPANPSPDSRPGETTPGRPRMSFSAFDLNGDGSVSEDEFNKARSEMRGGPGQGGGMGRGPGRRGPGRPGGDMERPPEARNDQPGRGNRENGEFRRGPGPGAGRRDGEGRGPAGFQGGDRRQMANGPGPRSHGMAGGDRRPARDGMGPHRGERGGSKAAGVCPNCGCPNGPRDGGPRQRGDGRGQHRMPPRG